MNTGAATNTGIGQGAPTKPIAPLPPTATYLPWVAIDLDGTLAEGIWTFDDPTSEIGQPLWANVKKLESLQERGWLVAIHTARPWGDYDAIARWLRWYSIEYNIIVCGKVLAAAYIDDRAINATAVDWTPPSVANV
jgi:hypothetical protein